MSGTERGERGRGENAGRRTRNERGGDLLKVDTAVQRPAIRSGPDPELQNGKRTLNRASWPGNCVARRFYEGARTGSRAFSSPLADISRAGIFVFQG